MGGPLAVIGVLTALVGAALLVLGLVAVRQKHVLAVALALGTAAILLPSGGLLITLSIGVEGYGEFAPGEGVAWVELMRTGPRGFAATVRLPDGRESTVSMLGGALAVEVHVLKPAALGRLVGLRDAYEVAAVLGRGGGSPGVPTPWASFSLAADKPVDAFELRRRFALLAPLLRAEALSLELSVEEEPAEYELRLLEGGLRLVRLSGPG